jgi:hypothetical protein
MRSGSEEVRQAMSRQGRYLEITEHMRVKQVRVSEPERFVICHNPDAADRDRATRERLVAQLQELIAGTDEWSEFKRGELRGKINSKPGLNRFLRATADGKLRVDAAKVKTEANFDGKYLLRCSDPKLSAEDIAVGYKQPLEVERGWRDMKSVLDLRPVYHRLEERIPRPRGPVLAGAAAGPDPRNPLRRHLAGHAPRTRPPARRHLHRPDRHLPAPHHRDQGPNRPARPHRHPGPEADHRAHTRNRLTSDNIRA